MNNLNTLLNFSPLKFCSTAIIAFTLGACGGAPTDGNNNSSSGGNNSSGGMSGSSSSSSGNVGGGKVDVPDAAPPGTKLLQRLNKVEYSNTIRDMFYGLEVDVTSALPPDSTLFGFDNIAEVQSLNLTIVSTYDAAVKKAVDAALANGAQASDGTPLANKLFTCNASSVNQSCARETLSRFAYRAWRRDITSQEMDNLMDLAATAEGDWFEGVSRGMHGALLSPNFLYRVEIDPNPNSAIPHLLNDYELATRLSYYLWSTMPDDELLAEAKKGGLNSPDRITEQVTRMMASPKAVALRDNFFGQWLFTRSLNDPLIKTASEFSPELQNSMRTETLMHLDRVISGELNLTEMLTTNETYVDERLADFYGISGVSGTQFQKVSLDGTNRKGLLTQAGMMAILADSAVTNPVIRGKWVSEEMLCTEPPPAPIVPPDFVDVEFDGAARDRLGTIIVGSCVGCHQLMDPAGLALENYDAIGKWRDQEEYKGAMYDIITAGTIPQLDGAFDNAVELVQKIAADDQYIHCASEKSLIYALGRGLSADEKNMTVDHISARLKNDGKSMRALIAAITTTDAFRMRHGGQ